MEKEIFGWGGTSITFLYKFPQIYKFYKSKTSKGISITSYIIQTFGYIFKIIDFGRAIYTFKGHRFCSDSYNFDGDAATQYNFEPYFNEKKPRLEPNFSFDLWYIDSCKYAFLCILYAFICVFMCFECTF